MKKLILLTLLICLSGSFVLAQSAQTSKHLKPSGFSKKVTVVIEGKERSYYSLNAEQAAVISVSGPGTLRVLTRARFEPGSDTYLGYELFYTLDGGEQQKEKMRDVVRSTQATFLNGTLGIPGDRQDFGISLNRGDHTIEFLLKPGSPPVVAQYIFTPAKEKKQDWIDLSPVQPSEPVDLVSSESTAGYYRFSNEKPLKILVNGPTELRVFTRMEFQYQMQGRINYRVQVSEDGKVKNTYQMSSTRSEATQYKNEKSMVPGKASEFVIEVPSGQHVYQVLPLDQDKSTLLGRAMILKDDVKLVK
jgi:hypothetical protein